MVSTMCAVWENQETLYARSWPATNNIQLAMLLDDRARCGVAKNTRRDVIAAICRYWCVVSARDRA